MRDGNKALRARPPGTRRRRTLGEANRLRCPGWPFSLPATRSSLLGQSYSPYGERKIDPAVGGGTVDTPFCFNGQWGVMTEATGLLYMQARYYSPILKRFLNEDPAGFAGGRNLYAYCSGDPVNAMDPFGLGAVSSSSNSGAASSLYLPINVGFEKGADRSVLSGYVSSMQTAIDNYATTNKVPTIKVPTIKVTTSVQTADVPTPAAGKWEAWDTRAWEALHSVTGPGIANVIASCPVTVNGEKKSGWGQAVGVVVSSNAGTYAFAHEVVVHRMGDFWPQHTDGQPNNIRHNPTPASGGYIDTDYYNAIRDAAQGGKK